jgi:hypothetical protein
MALGDGIRRDIATISDEERTLFINAIRKLDDPTSVFVYPNNAGEQAADANGNITYWDMMEQIHKDAHAHGTDVHFGPAFIPWHRVIVNHLEGLLRQVDPRLSLHYWDWTTDPRVGSGNRAALFNNAAGPGMMGSPNGNAGPPLADFESTEKDGDPLNGIPGDGVHDHIWRQVGSAAAKADGSPAIPHDSQILAKPDFSSFAAALKDAHDNYAHSYIGGTLTKEHFSFHDPVVFLLHSNLDRIWATWQRAPGHPERLDPAKAYGTIATDEGEPADYFDEWVQPWAGVDKNNVVQTGLNPWKSDASQQEHIPYNDPSVVIPASYDTAPHSSYIIVNRDTFSNSEIATLSGVTAYPYGPATFSNAFSIVYDGFTPRELGITSTPLPAVPPKLPAFAFTGAAKVTATNPSASYEDPSRAVDMPQRIVITFDLHFADGSDFPNVSGGESVANLKATLNYNVDTGTGGTIVPQTDVASTGLLLVNQPNPYMMDVPPGGANPYWLSIDTRVFQVKGPAGGAPAGSVLGVTQGDMDTDSNAPFTFITGVMAALQASPSQFDNTAVFPTDESASQLELSQKVGPPGMQQRVYNYVVARVRYRAPAGVWASSDGTSSGTGVSVFFRVFNTAVSALGYDAANPTTSPTGNYRRTTSTNAGAVPLLGIENDSVGNPETSSIPFFATRGVDPASVSMTTQAPDTPNIQTIPGNGSENVAFFGAWLDINLAPGDANLRRLPLVPSSANGGPNGPFSGAVPIQQLMLNTHHCLVAEVFFWPAGTTGDPIPLNASPSASDRLAQRNLVLVKSGNPGFPDTHRVQTTFLVKPSVLLFDRPGSIAAQKAPRTRAAGPKPGKNVAITPRYLGPDELVIRWNNVPRKSEATIYLPEVEADEILTLSALRQHPAVLEKVDTNTIRCKLADITFIPLPMNRRGTIAGLMSVTLPNGIKAGQVFRFSVEQYSGFTLRTLGAFQMTIPVRPDPELLPEEIRKLSVMRYIQKAIPVSSRWYPIFVRYLDEIARRVTGLGGDPNTVKPSPSGGEGESRPCPPQHPKEICASDLFCLNIPWKECDIEGELDIKLRFKRKCD